jgi:hypothetical protein
MRPTPIRLGKMSCPELVIPPRVGNELRDYEKAKAVSPRAFSSSLFAVDIPSLLHLT